MTLSQHIASHVSSARFEQLSSRAVQMTKYSLLDALGVMLGASGIGEGCDAFAQLALSASAKPEATILGYGARSSAALAAFANGAMAHALDFEDTHDDAAVHPNAQVIPAALALAEAFNVSGQQLLTAIAVGSDLTCRLALCLKSSLDNYGLNEHGLDEHGWYPPPIFGAFGATAAACNLLRLNERQTLDALSLTLNQTSCSGEIKNNPHSMIRSIRDAFPAQVAVVSAQLAQSGVRGFDEPFEGKAGFFNNFARGAFDPTALTRDLGNCFEGEYVSFKPWPACRGTHAYIECALELMRRHGLRADDIASGHMQGHPLQRMLSEPLAAKRAPATAIDAKFSLPFTVAVALCRGEVTLQSYGSDTLSDPQVLALARRLTFEVAPRMDSEASSNVTSGALELRTQRGDTYRMSIKHALGSTHRPLSERQLIEKFQRCAELARKPLSLARRDALVKIAMRMETCERVHDWFND